MAVCGSYVADRATKDKNELDALCANLAPSSQN